MTATAPSDRPVKEQFERVLRAFHGMQTVQVIGLGLELGLFAALHEAGALVPAELARRLNLHPPYVRVWCEVAAALGVLDVDDAGAFHLPTGMETVLLNPDHPRYLGAFARGFITHLNEDFARYPQAFRDGAVHPFGEHGEAFSEWVASVTHPMQRLVAGRILPEYFGEALTRGIDILDVGCGSGQLIFKLAEAYPNCRFVGVDSDPHGIYIAQKTARQRDLNPRVRFYHLDGQQMRDENNFDLALMFEVLHEIPLEARPGVLAAVYRALRPNAHLFILDETWPEHPSELRSPAYAMSILVQFSELIWGNIVATEREQTQLLRDAGFEIVLRSDLGGTFTLIFARKPA